MEQVEFKQLSEMSVEEILSLERGKLIVKQEYNEYRKIRSFNAYLNLLDDMLQIRFRLDRASYFVIAKLRNVDPSLVSKGEYVVSFPYRLVKAKGISKNTGKEFEYYYIEGFGSPKDKKVYLSSFLRGSQLDLVSCYSLNNIVDRGLVADSEEVNSESISYFDDLG